jgi:predicted nucleic acid-binding protein
MKLVIDASVAVKWIVADMAGEGDLDKAAMVLAAVARRHVEVIEPAHWVGEVVGVVARVRPDRVLPTIALVTHARFATVVSRAVYRRAAEIAIALNHHLFDTLYHAVALQEGATLVTADDAYYAKAASLGQIQRLGDFVVR